MFLRPFQCGLCALMALSSTATLAAPYQFTPIVTSDDGYYFGNVRYWRWACRWLGAVLLIGRIKAFKPAPI